MNNIKIQLPTDVNYWGSSATDSIVDGILDRLEQMIAQEFCDYEIVFERVAMPRGDGIICDDQDLHDNVFRWIQDNWSAAL